ncbi:hypothetical protein FACS189413_10430 [Bacteroidia bacterium]|nr:hypothetical protein FACS189413_10430 [Bacteroidia bacterium]
MSGFPEDVATPAMSLEEAEQLYRQAKTYFYAKEYETAIPLYQQIIYAFPDNIAYYDAFGRLLGAQQKILERAELFREGLLKNPGNPYFLHRLSLIIKKLYLGDKQAKIAFSEKYDYSGLLEPAAEMMLQAVRLKPNDKGFYLDLRDFLNIAEKENNAIPESLLNEIRSVSAQYDEKWTTTRTSRKPVMAENTEQNIEKIKKRKRRSVPVEQELQEQNKAIRKAKKHCWKQGLEKSIAGGKNNKIGEYAVSILAENPKDTDTVGKTRRCYKKARSYNQLIEFNRYLYRQNPATASALALASTLIKHGNGNSVLTEINRILSGIRPERLAPVYKVSYYLSAAQLKIKEKKAEEARKLLLQGLSAFEGKGGFAYSLLELYALSFTSNVNNPAAASINLLKVLCGKTATVNDPVKMFLETYRNGAIEKPLSTGEQLKPLYALAKLQQKSDKNGYKKTMADIENLKTQKR